MIICVALSMQPVFIGICASTNFVIEVKTYHVWLYVNRFVLSLFDLVTYLSNGSMCLTIMFSGKDDFLMIPLS